MLRRRVPVAFRCRTLRISRRYLRTLRTAYLTVRLLIVIRRRSATYAVPTRT